jgi:hypothetical protein
VFFAWGWEYPISYLTAVDVSDPSQPVVTGTFEFEPYTACRAMVVDGNRLIVATDGLDVFDVSGGGAPREIGAFDYASAYFSGLAVDNGWLFAIDPNNGSIAFFDVSRGPDPLLAHSIDTPEPIDFLDVSARYAYASGNHDFRILDVKNPAAPVEVGRWQSEYGIEMYAVNGDYVYVWLYTGTSAVTVAVLDVSDPTAPQVRNVIEGFPCWGLNFSGEHAYCASEASLFTFDVQDPVVPELVSTLEFEKDVAVLNVIGGLLYANTPGALHVVDLSNPAAPAIVGRIGGLGGRCCRGIDVHNGYAYVLGYLSLLVLDVSAPTAPVLLQTYNRFCGDEASCRHVRYVPRDLLLVNGTHVTLYDISEPTNLVEVATGPWLGGLHLVGAHICSPAHDSGVATLGLASCPGYGDPRLPRRPSRRVGRSP